MEATKEIGKPQKPHSGSYKEEETPQQKGNRSQFLDMH
jgi:hypothetical protein